MKGTANARRQYYPVTLHTTMHELAAKAVQSLGLLSLALEQRRVAIDAEDVAELSRACARLAHQLDARDMAAAAGSADEQPTPLGDDELEIIEGGHGSETPRTAHDVPRGAARLRQRHLDMSNNRLTARHNSKFGHQLEANFVQVGADLGAMRQATTEAPTPQGDAAPYHPADGGAMAPSDLSEELQVMARLQPMKGREPEGSESSGTLDAQLRPRHHRAEEYQGNNVRHAQRRSAVLDSNEVAKALEAAERALGLQLQQGSVGLAPPPSDAPAGYQGKAAQQVDGDDDLPEALPVHSSRHAAKFRQHAADMSNNRLTRRRGASIGGGEEQAQISVLAAQHMARVGGGA